MGMLTYRRKKKLLEYPTYCLLHIGTSMFLVKRTRRLSRMPCLRIRRPRTNWWYLFSRCCRSSSCSRSASIACLRYMICDIDHASSIRSQTKEERSSSPAHAYWSGTGAGAPAGAGAAPGREASLAVDSPRMRVLSANSSVRCRAMRRANCASERPVSSRRAEASDAVPPVAVADLHSPDGVGSLADPSPDSGGMLGSSVGGVCVSSVAHSMPAFQYRTTDHHLEYKSKKHTSTN